MPEKKVRYHVQVVVPEGAYEADSLISDLTDLVELNSEIEIVSVELDPENVTPEVQLAGDPGRVR